MKFVDHRPHQTPQDAARKLLQIICRSVEEVGRYTYTGVTNTSFLREDGTVALYRAGIAEGVARRWFEVDSSGTRLVLLEAGKALATGEQPASAADGLNV